MFKLNYEKQYIQFTLKVYRNLLSLFTHLGFIHAHKNKSDTKIYFIELWIKNRIGFTVHAEQTRRTAADGCNIQRPNSKNIGILENLTFHLISTVYQFGFTTSAPHHCDHLRPSPRSPPPPLTTVTTSVPHHCHHLRPSPPGTSHCAARSRWGQWCRTGPLRPVVPHGAAEASCAARGCWGQLRRTGPMRPVVPHGAAEASCAARGRWGELCRMGRWGVQTATYLGNKNVYKISIL